MIGASSESFTFHIRKSYSLHFVFGLLRGEGAGRRELAVADTSLCSLKPVLNWGRMFLREPSWKYSAKLVGS